MRRFNMADKRGGRTVRFKAGGVGEELIKNSPDFRQPKKKKKKQCNVVFLDDSGRPVHGRPRRPRNLSANVERDRVNNNRKGTCSDGIYSNLCYSFSFRIFLLVS